MPKTLPVFFLFVIIVLEGYVVLSSELLAIRQSIPFVGSGTDTVSIIIAAVLMPLAFGYQAGGRFKPGFNENGKYHSIRRKLITNILISMVILLGGLSYFLINLFFMALINLGLENRLILATIYALTFIVTPVYLLGQTIPLVSNYFSKQKLAKITGKILFFSTLGSFMGATFSTLVLMAHIGVHYTATLNFIILAVLIILLSRRKLDERPIIAIALAAAAIYLNSGAMMKNMNIVANNQYNTIVVTEKKTKDDTQRFLILNNNSSSMYSEKGRNHPYIEFIEKTAIDPLIAAQEPKDILIIGAGAFTLGFRDNLNRYDYVDIDKDLKHISETYVLKEKLLDNKTFHPIPARAFLAGTDKKYDLIILDAYLGDLTLPEHLITAEFFEAVKAHLNNGGAVMANFIVSPNFNNRYSRTIDNTFRFVFKNISRHAMESQYAIWNTDENALHNVVYIYKDQNDADIDTLYTDNKNRVFYDKPKQHGSVLKRPNAQENTLHSHE